MARCNPFIGNRQCENNTEEWKEFLYDPDYEISNYGNVRRLGSPTFLSRLRFGKGTICISIRQKIYSLGRLVALHFLPNPDNLPRVYFKDGDNTNPHVSNLSWAKSPVNKSGKYFSQGPPVLKMDAKTHEILQTYPSRHAAATALNMTATAFNDNYIKIQNELDGCVYECEQDKAPDGEVWVPCRHPNLENYEVSNFMRVRRQRGRKALKPYEYPHGYIGFSIKRTTFLLHRIIAFTFLYDSYRPGMDVNHIDGNPKNNRLENLEWVTVSENNQKAHALKRARLMSSK